MIGPTELRVILLVVLIVFGAGKLPQVGGALGKSIKDFRQESTTPDDEREANQRGGPPTKRA